MLRSIIICPDAGVVDRLGTTLADFDGSVQLCRVIDEYQSQLDLLRTLRAHAPELIFLSFENVPQAVATVKF